MEIVYRFLVIVYKTFIEHPHIRSNPTVFILNVLSYSVVFYFAIVIIVYEGIFLFSGLVVAKYFRALNKRMYCCCNEKEINAVMKQHHNLHELTRLFNKTFSVFLLSYNGFYFVTLLLRIMSLYCNIRVNKESSANVEIVGLCFSALKLGWIITVSNDCTFEVYV